MSESIVSTLLKKIDQPELMEKLTSLTLSELNSLMLAIFRKKSTGITPVMLLESYQNNRFVRPSSLDPMELMQFKLNLLKMADLKGFQPMELSPLAPFGCCSVLAPVDQNNVVSAVRGSEILSDATNVLALEAGVRRKNSPEKPVNLCCTARHVRAQTFDDPNFSAHFELFCMVTADRDNGGFSFEKEALYNHLAFYLALLKETKGTENLFIVIKSLAKSKHEVRLFESAKNHITDHFPGYSVEIRKEHENFTYYSGLRFNIILVKNGNEHLVVDGGLTDWTQKLLSDKKERLLTSGLGIEYLLKLIA